MPEPRGAQAQQQESALKSPGGPLGDFASLFGPIGQMIVAQASRLIAGSTTVQGARGGVTVPAGMAQDPFAAGRYADNALNNAAWAPVRDRIYTRVARLEEAQLSHWVSKAFNITDPEQVRGTVSSIMGVKRAISNSPMLQMVPQLKGIPFLRDNSADITKAIMESAAGYGLNSRNASPQQIARYGAVAEAAAEAMMTTETGLRRPSDVAKFLSAQLASGTFGDVLLNNRMFQADNSLNDGARRAVAGTFRQRYALAEELSHSLGMEDKPLGQVWAEAGDSLIGRPIQDGDIDDVRRLMAVKESAGISDVRPFIISARQKLGAQGLPDGLALKYTSRALAQFSALKSTRGHAGGTAGQEAQRGIMGQSDQRIIDDYISMNIAAPVVGYNPMFVAGAAMMKQNGDMQSYRQFNKLIANDYNPQQAAQFLQERGYWMNPNVAKRFAFTKAGEEAYNDLSDKGGHTFFLNGFANAYSSDVHRMAAQFGGAGDMTDRMWKSHLGMDSNQSGTQGEAFLNAAIGDFTEQGARKYGLTSASSIAPVMGSPDYLGNVSKAWNDAQGYADQKRRELYPVVEQPSSPLEAMRSVLGGRKGVSFAASPLDSSKKLPRSAHEQLAEDLGVWRAPAAATPVRPGTL